MTYTYERRVASMEGTVGNFLLILRGNLIQDDAAQQKRNLKRGVPSNPYALGLLMDALKRVRTDLQASLGSKDPSDLEAAKKAITRRFNDVPPIRKTIKAIDDFIRSGKNPKYPTGVGSPPQKISSYTYERTPWLL